MSEFFPGSRQPLTPPAGPPDPLAGVKGQTFPIGGREVELFTITELSRVLNRKPVTIRKYEREGIIPKATYVKNGQNKDPRGKRRLYSREQILALWQIAMEEGILYDMHKRIQSTQFKTKALAAFKEIAARNAR